MTSSRVTSTVLDRSRLALVGLLLVLAAVGWTMTGARMEGMDAGPGTALGSLGFYVSAWVVMMAAMMFPSIAPMVLTYNRIHTHRRELGKRAPAGATATFVSGYLVSWTLFGLAAYAVFDTIHSLSIEALSWDRGGKYLAGGVIMSAAVYQLTPAKNACLRKCRGPLDFVLGGWRDGLLGAFRLGLNHGAWCVGCCWALMAALFAFGVMSVGWMLFVAALIAVEKMLPWMQLANRGVALLLLTLGLMVAFAPGRVPGLTLPDSQEARQAMMRMGGSMGGGEMKGEQMSPRALRRSSRPAR